MATKHFTIASLCMVGILGLSLGNIPQTISQEGDIKSSIKKASGVETVEFDTLVGTVEVNLPDDLSDTDTISGTVLVEPKGDNKEEIAQNEDTLRGYVIEIEKTQEVPEPPPTKQPPPTTGPPRKPNPPPKCPPRKPNPPPKCPPGTSSRSGGTCPPTSGLPPTIYVVPGCRGGFTAAVPPKCGGIRVTVKNSGGNTICSMPVPTNPIPPRRPPGCSFPPTCTAGGPICIPGPTDGRSSTTNVKVNGQTCPPICESPRQTVAQTPGNVKGPCTVSLTECGQTSRGTVKMLPPPTTPPKPQPPTQSKDKYVFRRTGPFITEKNQSRRDQQLVVSKNQITFTGYGVNTPDRKTTCSFNFNDLPETLTVGDRFSFIGQIAGDPGVSPLASFGCRSEGLWTKQLTPPIYSYSNSPTLLNNSGPGYVPSGTQTYEVLDGMKKIDEYKRNNPDKANLIKDEHIRQIDMVLYTTAGGGDISAELKWIYVLDDRLAPRRSGKK